MARSREGRDGRRNGGERRRRGEMQRGGGGRGDSTATRGGAEGRRRTIAVRGKRPRKRTHRRAGGTLNGEGEHHADGYQVVLGLRAAGDELRVEVRRDVLVEDLAFTHDLVVFMFNVLKCSLFEPWHTLEAAMRWVGRTGRGEKAGAESVFRL